MKGFLVVHISALVVWIGCLVYLPALIASHMGSSHSLEERPHPYDSLSRLLFTRLATPSALVAIIAGTAVFVIDITFHPWLIAKLTVVCLLVVLHTLTGVLVVRAENKPEAPVALWSGVLMAGSVAAVLIILWLVLAKPPVEDWL
ncbi:CopD family protein [Marinobacter sp.]|uniref:CopD family protein n=1 Tax=Marinobacter sp. TaxID=50741 RepID=UPI0035660A21